MPDPFVTQAQEPALRRAFAFRVRAQHCCALACPDLNTSSLRFFFLLALYPLHLHFDTSLFSRERNPASIRNLFRAMRCEKAE